MKPDTQARIARLLPDLVVLRRDIHAHPELGMEETRTAALVAERLRAMGLETTEGVGRFGVVGTLRGRRPGQGAIGLRADMDALALSEQTGLPYASTAPGRMHACGHDGHTTMLLGAAQMLAEDPDFAGTVHFLFQPAEEGRGGAKAMLDDQLFERFPCDAVYGMHNMPGLPLGQFALREGPLMAGSGRWITTFRGKGGHGGNSPHLANDLALVQAVFIQMLQGIVSRNVPALESVVVSVGHIAGGAREALNVMPAELVVGGTMRAFNPAMQELVERRIRELAELAAASQGATVEVTLWWNAIPLVNHARETEVMAAAARAVAGEDGVDTATRPVTGGEDFAFMLKAKPGAFVFLGTGAGADGTVHALHSALYDFNDAALPHGVAFWVSLVRQELGATG
ncbi:MULTISPECIES: M20 aminoacylase family protein [Roseomonadaceae]|uniref:Amidohydrolase n=1 Tax=Falsiroseomonas oleicola TaxID=2801474 RepID=A0ABS6H803_9PROT|nr:M20 aminoacylase family protein [Roseomonas oleicola]MBU8544830.1 amidohydrolase [Roseomonas oleicola]